MKQGPAEVVQSAQAVAGQGEAVPAAGGSVDYGLREGDSPGLAGEAADDLAAAAAIAEGTLDDVGVLHALVVLDRETPGFGGR